MSMINIVVLFIVYFLLGCVCYKTKAFGLVYLTAPLVSDRLKQSNDPITEEDHRILKLNLLTVWPVGIVFLFLGLIIDLVVSFGETRLAKTCYAFIIRPYTWATR